MTQLDLSLMPGEPHDWLEVGARRWCMGCNSFQRLRSGKWQDDHDMLGPWPGYSRTGLACWPVQNGSAI